MNKWTARRLLIILSTWLLFGGLMCLSQAQPQFGFPPGTFQSRAAIDASVGNSVTLDQVGTVQGVDVGGGGFTVDSFTVTGGLVNSGLIALVSVSGGTSATSPTANWDALGTPQAMTLLINQDAGAGRQVFIFGLRNPTSGNKRLSITWTGVVQAGVNTISFSHVNPASDAAAFPNYAGSNSGGTPDSITITTGTGNYAIAGYSSLSNFSSVSDNQLFLDNSGAVWAIAANYKAATGATDTLTGSPGNAISTIAGGAIAHD